MWDIPRHSSRELYFSASARLAVWDTYEGDRETFLRKLSGILQDYSHGSIEFRNGEPSITDDPIISSLTGLLDQIVTRGNPTLTPPDLEATLLSSPSLKKEIQTTDLAEETANRLVGRKLQSLNNGISLDDLVETARRQLVSPWSQELLRSQLDQSLSPTLRDLVSFEEDLFYQKFGEVFGAGAQRLLRRKQPLRDLTSNPTGALGNHRVDFAFRFGPVRWIFEIDEEQLQSDLVNREERRRHDQFLQDQSWEVHRLSSEEVRGDITHRLTLLRNALPINLREALQALSDTDLSAQTDDPAFRSILVPHLIQKILRAMIQLFRYGAIPSAGPVKLLAVEEELSLLPEALCILLDLWHQIAKLAPDVGSPPEITLEVLGDKLFEPPDHSGLQVKQISKPRKKYDLIISHAFTLFSGQRGPKELQLEPEISGPVVEIRSAPIHREYRSLEQNTPLEFLIPDFPDPPTPPDPDEESHDAYLALQYFLRHFFRKYDFWEGQPSAIARLLHGENTTVLLPSGGGKSLIYQFAGLLLPGITLVIDPLPALMRDQIDNLNTLGIDRTGYVTGDSDMIDVPAISGELANGTYSFLYIGPEILQTLEVKEELRGVTDSMPLTLAVVDEAHCISEWGHDFRPEYTGIGEILRKYCTSDLGDSPALLGLTGTASFHVLIDIQREIMGTGEDAVIQATSLNRTELVSHVERADTVERSRKLQSIRKSLPAVLRKNPQRFFEPRGDRTMSGIIYSAETIAEEPVQLADQLGHRQWFSASCPENQPYSHTDWQKQNLQSQRRFKRNAVQELVASPEFGIGIDKENIRYTIHYTMPDSIEAFYQEAGRAGRTGQANSAHNFILYNDTNWNLAEELVKNPSHSDARERLQSLNGTGRGDFLLQLEHLYSRYPGKRSEKATVLDLWADRLTQHPEKGESENLRFRNVPYENDVEREKIQRALYRLTTIGVVKEYSLVPEKSTILVELRELSQGELIDHLETYLLRYKFDEYVDQVISDVESDSFNESLEKAIAGLTDFVYDEIVSEKIRSLHRMATLCRDYEDDDQFRQHLLDHLRESRFVPTLRSWMHKPFDKIGVKSVQQVLSQVHSLEEAQRLVGSCAKLLEDHPDNLALRTASCGAKMRGTLESDQQVSAQCTTLINQVALRYTKLKDPDALLLMLFGELIHWRKHLVDDLLDIALRKIGTLNFIRGYLENYREAASESNRHSMILIASAEGLVNAVNTGFYQSIAEGV